MDPQTAQQTSQTPASTPPVASATPPMTSVEATAPMPPQQPAPSSPSTTTPASPAGNTPTGTDPQHIDKKSSNKMWIIMIVVIVLILAVAGWFLYQYSMNKTSDSSYQDTTISPTAVPTIGAVQSGDKQLDQQSQTIDEDMTKAEVDVKGVDAGLNDKSVDLSQ